MTSVEELAEQLAAMQQQMANMVKGDDKLPIQDDGTEELSYCTGVVSQNRLPVFERESRIDMVSQPIDEDLAKAKMEDGEEVPEEIKFLSFGLVNHVTARTHLVSWPCLARREKQSDS